MTKIDKKVKEQFIKLYKNKKFTLDDALNFFNEYMSIDREDAELHYKKRIIRSLISAKNENKERIWVSFKEKGNNYFANPDTTKDIKALDSMEEQINHKINGLRKTEKKILKNKSRVMKGQVALKEIGGSI